MTKLAFGSLLFSCVLAMGCGRASVPRPEPASSLSGSATPAKPAPGGSQLLAGLGEVHHPIKSTNPEAQKFFEQGMALAFGFNHEAAIRSFDRAAELDPNAPMPYWGKAWALGPNYNMDVDDDHEKQAYAAITRAKSLAANGSDIERAYIDAMATRYSNDMKANRGELARRYSTAMGELSKKYPDDLDAATLYAESLMDLNPWKLWSADGKPAPGTDRIVSVLESVLQRDPNHLGANHYYIHAVEASPTPSRALPSAMRLDTMAPESGHIVHMPAHIYARTGNFESSARANSGGAAADVRYLATAPPDSMYGMMYYSHNLMFLANDNMMRGRFEDARKPAELMAKRLDPMVAMLPFIESVLTQPESVLLRFNRTDELLALAAPPANRPVQTAWHHFARGVTLARIGKLDEAATERAALAETTAKMPDSALWGGSGFMSGKTAMAIAALVLDARVAWAKQQRDQSIQLWQRAVAAADKLPYDEPPDWYYPIRESLGAALLMADKPADAERVFRDDLNRNPRNPRSLFGLHAALAKQGKDADAAWVQQQFDQAWKNADTKLRIEDL